MKERLDMTRQNDSVNELIPWDFSCVRRDYWWLVRNNLGSQIFYNYNIYIIISFTSFSYLASSRKPSFEQGLFPWIHSWWWLNVGIHYGLSPKPDHHVLEEASSTNDVCKTNEEFVIILSGAAVCLQNNQVIQTAGNLKKIWSDSKKI